MNNSDLFSLGDVVDFNPVTYSADVILDDGRHLSGIPVSGLMGSDFSQDVTWLSDLVGCKVWVLQAQNQKCIIGTQPSRLKKTRDAVGASHGDASITDKAREMHRASGFHNYNPNRPTDVLPGDKVIRADGGTEMSLTQGGIARLKASPLAQFILSRYRSLGRLITRRFQFFSDFGEVETFHSADGRVGFSVKGGAVYTSETNPENPDWTVHVRLGDARGDSSDNSRLFIKTTAPGGENEITFCMDTEGDAVLNAKKNVRVITGENTEVLAEKDISLKAEGDVVVTVGGDASISTDGDASVSAGGDATMSASGIATITASKINLN